MTVKLLIYEDNENLAKSLTVLFKWQDDYELMAVLPNAQTVMNDIEAFTPDVILLDIDMPGITGVEALKKIRAVYPELPVIMFTVFDDDDNIFNAMCHGASGYLLKNNFDQVMPALADVLSGGAPMTSAVAKRVLQLFAHPKAKQTNTSVEDAALTKREADLLQLLVKGYSYKMIAAELSIALETVRAHIKKVYKKLQVNSATEAVYKVLHK
ncbi:MAG: response regulator transcription factor [Chitinophagaceae bacterium]|nr:MAG: response regulator transcription factor [Chitinophagaceae bacterium]